MEFILDKLVNVGGAFLVLSLVAEKLADFLKLRKAELRDKSTDPIVEKRREHKIVTHTIWVGIIIALILKADAIQMVVSGEAGEVLGWDNVLFYDQSKAIEFADANYDYFKALSGTDAHFGKIAFTWIQTFVGIILTGVALSFGSKFWHDLLGLLYEMKDAKAKIAERS